MQMRQNQLFLEHITKQKMISPSPPVQNSTQNNHYQFTKTILSQIKDKEDQK